MDKFETDFLKTQKLQSFVWFTYIDDIFFIWTRGKEELENFMKQLNSFRDHIKFTCGSNKENINFLGVSRHLMTNIYVNPLMPGGNKKVTHTLTNLQLSAFV